MKKFHIFETSALTDRTRLEHLKIRSREDQVPPLQNQ